MVSGVVGVPRLMLVNSNHGKYDVRNATAQTTLVEVFARKKYEYGKRGDWTLFWSVFFIRVSFCFLRVSA